MQRLLLILQAFKEYVLLVVLVIASIVLLGINDNAQIRAIRSYTVGFIGAVQNVLAVVPNVFALRRENEILRELNVNLSDEVNRLRAARLENFRLRGMLGFKERTTLPLLPADIVGKSLYLLRNTITLNVGEAEGVRPDMPIISDAGLVGRITVVSGHYSVGQLMLNKDFRASAKVQRSRVDGIISWGGGDVVLLKNVAKKQDVREGDIIITSEYSNIYPPDIKIGSVVRVYEKPGNLFKEIEVAPVVDFATLEQVFVIAASPDSGRTSLETRIQRPQ